MNDRDYWNSTWKKGLGKTNAFAKRAATFLSPKAHILDLGCGTGKDSLYFAKKGHRVTAIDYSQNAVDWLTQIAAKETLNIVALCRNLTEKLPFKDDTIDAVYAHLSLHYFNEEDTERIFGEIHRVLKKKGLFFVKCKSVDDPHYGRGKEVAKDMFVSTHTRHFFRKEYMQKLLERSIVLRLRRMSSTYMNQRSSFIEAIARK